jgi:hypothetical protein
MNTNIRRALTALGPALLTCMLLPAQQPMPKTTTEKIHGESEVTTETLSGTVVAIEGNALAVRLDSGELREFDVPESRVFVVDGKELSIRHLKLDTYLTATVTTTMTPVTERTTTVGSGKVWYVSGNNVIVTLPNHENKMFKVEDSYRFDVNGRPASVHDLKKGMTISAVKVVESPKTVISSNTVVKGHRPSQRRT